MCFGVPLRPHFGSRPGPVDDSRCLSVEPGETQCGVGNKQPGRAGSQGLTRPVSQHIRRDERRGGEAEECCGAHWGLGNLVPMAYFALNFPPRTGLAWPRFTGKTRGPLAAPAVHQPVVRGVLNQWVGTELRRSRAAPEGRAG